MWFFFLNFCEKTRFGDLNIVNFLSGSIMNFLTQLKWEKTELTQLKLRFLPVSFEFSLNSWVFQCILNNIIINN